MNMPSPETVTRRAGRSRAGFTLIESALTTVIVGTGVLAIVAAQQAYHMKNDWAQRTGMAMLLANEIRETTLNLPFHDPLTGASNLGPESDEASVADYDDLDDFAGLVDSATGRGEGLILEPPINALRQPVDDLDNWRQVVEVASVWEDNISSDFGVTPALDEPGTLKRVTVRIEYRDPADAADPDAWVNVTELTWVVTGK